MEKIHIEKGSVQETLIVPLYARKLCAEQFPTLYQDKYAAMICDRLDYDFTQFKKKESSALYQFGGLEGAMREKDILWEIADYLKDHPKAAVVNMGCGLNMTGRSADNGTCRIYNLDFPYVIRSRNQIIPAGEREENIACDLNDYSWMEKIDGTNGAIFYAAGVLHYFTTEQVRSLAAAMAEKFPGGRLVFDTVGKFGRDVLMKGTLKNMGIMQKARLTSQTGLRKYGWPRERAICRAITAWMTRASKAFTAFCPDSVTAWRRCISTGWNLRGDRSASARSGYTDSS